MKRLAFALTSTILLLLSYQSAAACQCRRDPDEKVTSAIAKQLKQSFIVFSGEAIERNQSGLRFRVENVWKGKPASEILFSSPIYAERASDESEAFIDSCALLFEVGKKYLVYAYRVNNELFVSKCSRTRELDSAQRDLSVLNRLKPKRARITRSSTAVVSEVYYRNQAVKKRDSENTFRGVTLSFLSQRCLPKNKVPYVGDDFIDFSDMTTRFRLSNRSSKNVYYLANAVTSTADPVGFQLFRPNNRGDWDAPYTTARGRADVFTGEGVRWMLLRPGSIVEFESLDFSRQRGQHATSVFLNTKPTHDNRVELVSNAFVPIHCRKRGK